MTSVIYYLCFLLVCVPFLADAQINGNITVGANLSATINGSSQWLSFSGDFAFGFKQLGDEDLFLLAIWYAKIPDKTIVWYLKAVSPVSSGSTISLTSGDGLILSDSAGDQVWKSDFTGASVAYAVMNNTGNLMLKSSDSSVLWESFELPTDTILPTQIIERGGFVSSRRSETNFSTGRFRLNMQQDGNLVLNSINLPGTYANEPYYASGTNDEANSTNAGYQLLFNERGSLFILRSNGLTKILSSGEVGSESDFYYRATLDFDGVFTIYRHPKNSSGGSWTTYWSKPDDICLSPRVNFDSGVCGYNSLCRLNADNRPACECPEGYSLLDPNDTYGSCKIDRELSCAEENSQKSSPENLYRIEKVSNIDWPLADYTLLTPFTEDECRQSCLQDCLCAVAISGSPACWKKKLPLSNGRVENGNGRIAFIKLWRDNVTFGSESHHIYPDLKVKDDQDGLVVTGSVLLSASAFFNFVLLSAVCYISHMFYHKKHQKTHRSTETNIRYFTFKELVEATNGFREELGRGAFGIVYKGKLETGSNGNNDAIAVKKLDKRVQDGEKEFMAEMNVIGQTQHKNLVRLFGFCDEGENRLLVYEFLPNGTLADFLFGSSKPSWIQRMEIAFSIARGLLYLHEECRTQIIHCDIKPQNILLDDNFNACISDFGLAKLLMLDQSHTNTGIRGTKGYVASEWFRNMPITAKVDVYSFGVLLLEVISCRKNVDMNVISTNRAILTDWAYDCYQETRLDELVVEDFEALNDEVNLERYVMIAIWCIQEDPSLRPNMRKVTQMFDGVVEVHVPPCPSPFTIETSV